MAQQREARRRTAARGRTGRAAEELVARHLATAGWTVIARNIRVGRSELDLLAVDPGPPVTLVVVEVRANRTSLFGPPEASVSRHKLGAVYRGALSLRAGGLLPDGTALPRHPLRVDLVTVEMAPFLDRTVAGPVVRHLRGLIG